MRAPHLAVGGDNMFQVLEDYDLLYDSSISSLEPSWPYTLQYKMEQSCPLPPCAEKSHPGVWEIPITRLTVIHNECFHLTIFFWKILCVSQWQQLFLDVCFWFLMPCPGKTISLHEHCKHCRKYHENIHTEYDMHYVLKKMICSYMCTFNIIICTMLQIPVL